MAQKHNYNFQHRDATMNYQLAMLAGACLLAPCTFATTPTRGRSSPHQVTGNELTANDAGLDAQFGPVRIAQNNITGNTRGIDFTDGGSPTPSAPLVVRNNVFGIKAYGVEVFQATAGGLPKLRENNIYGNGLCGTHNGTSEALDARNNFWGAATGPSDTDPADNACSALVPTRTSPFATSEFAVH